MKGRGWRGAGAPRSRLPLINPRCWLGARRSWRRRGWGLRQGRKYRGDCRVQLRGSQQTTEAPSACLPSTLLCPTPKKRHRECTVLPIQSHSCARILPGQLSPLQETSPKIKPPPCTHLSLWGTLFAHQDGDTGAILRLRLLKALGKGVCREPRGSWGSPRAGCW